MADPEKPAKQKTGTERPAEAQEKQNRSAFKKLLPNLVAAHQGKFALVHGGKLIDVFDTMDAAYEAGVDRFGLDSVFVGHITLNPPTQHAPALQHGLLRVRL